MTKEVKIKPRCLTFPMTDPEHMPAAYTSDGYMLPCCWLDQPEPVSYTHLRAHETGRNLVCRLLLEKKK